MTPVHGTQLNVQKIDVPYGTSETEVAARGVDLMTIQVDAPYEFAARQPKSHEVSYGRQTLSLIDYGSYSLERLKVYAEKRDLAAHTLHGSMGALFDVVCIATGIKKPAQAGEYAPEEGITRGELFEAIYERASSRTNTLNRLVDAVLSRQSQALRPDRKNELVVQGELHFSHQIPTISWESMSYDALKNLIARHKAFSQMGQLLQELYRSKTGRDSV